MSPDETGLVDRKLNVALTRQQLLLPGNPEILAAAPHHAALLRRVPGYPTRWPEQPRRCRYRVSAKRKSRIASPNSFRPRHSCSISLFYTWF